MSTALADIQKEIQKQVAAQKENVPPTGGKISTKGKVFTLPDGTVIPEKIEGVILDYRFNNVYFSGQWDGQSKDRPECSASGLSQDTLAPGVDIKDPVAPECAGCPMNEWGSAANGRGGKACQNKVRLAVVTSDADGKAPIYTLDLTPTGLKSFQAFMDQANVSGKLPVNYVTEITMDPTSTFPSVRLKPLGINESLETHWVLRERAQNIL